MTMLMRGRALLHRVESAATWFLPHAHLAVLAVALLIGALTVSDYGESWDEQIFVEYGEYGLRVYGEVFQGRPPPSQDAFMEQYGPAFLMLGAAIASLASALGARWDPVVTWHALYFVTYLASVELVYGFSRRWLSTAASVGTTILYASQPLLWGHAFINPKDIPFLTLFLASVHLGFSAVDGFRTSRFSNLKLLVAAGVLGISGSVRSIGPLAGLFVALYACLRLRRQCIPFLAAYAVVAAAAIYATWPFLWPAPLERFLLSLQTMSSFPFFMKTQFMGSYFAATELPWFYVPMIFGIQLTEPALLMILLGLLLTLWQVLTRTAGTTNAKALLLLFVGWTLLPLLAILGTGRGFYDNARQLFFLLPPIFLLAGVSLGALERLIPSRALMLSCLCLLTLPGLWSSLRLHPYEYVYYNALVGGTGGAYGKFEMDYWATSYADVRDWLNLNAPHGSRIWIPGGPTYLIARGLRPDLQISCVAETDCGVRYDYYVALARLRAERRCRGGEIVHTVGRQEAVFSVVMQLPEGKVCR